MAFADDALQLPVTSGILVLTKTLEGVDPFLERGLATLGRGIQRIHTEGGMQVGIAFEQFGGDAVFPPLIDRFDESPGPNQHQADPQSWFGALHGPMPGESMLTHLSNPTTIE